MTYHWQAMGTEFTLYLAGHPDPDPIAEMVREEVRRLERQISLYHPDSELCYLNAWAWRQPVQVEPELFCLLHTCKNLWERTRGAFDPTITPLLRLWGFVDKQYRVPSPDAIENALHTVGMDLVLLEPEGRWGYYATEGVELSFGAIGKGLAVALGARMLEEMGVASALLSAGNSTLYALGVPPESDGWQVQITPHTTLSLVDQAFATSGASEQFFEVDGVRYAHILDPRTGYPANKSKGNVSVCHTDPVLCDALSTALFVEPDLVTVFSEVAVWWH